MTTRRQALAILVFGLGVRASGVRAQSPPKRPRIGILIAQPRSGRLPVDAFVDALHELGYTDGLGVVIEWRYAGGQTAPLPALARELVRLGVDVIHAVGPDAIEAARTATTTIPIVGVGGADPVAVGWAVSLGHPGGNVTGLTANHPDVPGKALELLKEAVPGLTRVAAFYDSVAYPPGSRQATVYSRNVLEPARRLGLQLHTLGISGPGDIDQAFAAATKWQAQALHVTDTPTLLAHRLRLAELAARSGLPAIAYLRQTAEAGFLMAYGPDVADLHRRAAVYVDKILRGARAGNLPFELPAKFELILNARTARALGLAIPPSLRLRADHVIE